MRLDHPRTALECRTRRRGARRRSSSPISDERRAAARQGSRQSRARSARKDAARSASAQRARAAWRRRRRARSSSPCTCRRRGSSSPAPCTSARRWRRSRALLGYDVTIVDPRTAFATPERFPDVKLIAEWPDVALPPLGVDRYTAFVALTHDPKIDDPALMHALARDCFYIGALGSKKTHARRARAAEGAGRRATRARAHPCADRARHRRGVAGGDRGRDHGRDHRRGCACTPEARSGMKFGAGRRRARRTARSRCTRSAQGGMVLKKGTLIGKAEIAALEAAGIAEIVVARLEPGDVSEDVAAAEIAAAVAGEGVHVDRAFTGRANLFAETRRRAGRRQGRRSIALNRVDEAITFATLAGLRAGRRRRDDRDREDHSVRGRRRGARQGAGGRARREAAGARRALSSVRKVGIVSTVLPGLADKVIEKTLQDHRRAARAGGRRRSSPRRACRTRPRRWRGARRGARSRRRARHRVRRLRHRRPARRDPGGDRSGRRARSSISACRSIPAICC